MKHSKRKAEIYSAAVQLFKDRGYAAASMRDIAEAVGIEASSLYSHIKSKEEILRDVCMKCSKLFAEGMADILDSDGTYLDKVKALVQLHIDIAVDYPSSVTVFNYEWKHLPADALEPFINSRRAYEHSFRTLLKEGMDAGEFTTRSSRVVFNILISSTKWLHYYPREITNKELERFKSNTFSFLEAGLVN